MTTMNCDGWDKFASYLGEPPDFHDAEVTSITLAHDSVHCRIEFKVYRFVSNRLFTVSLDATDIIEIRILGWGGQNVVSAAKFTFDGHCYFVDIEPIPGLAPTISIKSRSLKFTILELPAPPPSYDL